VTPALFVDIDQLVLIGLGRRDGVAHGAIEAAVWHALEASDHASTPTLNVQSLVASEVASSVVHALRSSQTEPSQPRSSDSGPMRW
jgi:hypothetical protein